MGKTAKAPSGFYTAKDVMEKLGMANSTLYHYVETGKIKKVIPPGRKEGYYPKAEIDKMVRAKELFILQYATDASFFDKAEEADIEKITELGIEVFGKHGSPNYETRLAQFHANPDIFYVLRQDELIVGYLGLFPLKHEAIEAIMAGMEENRFRTGIINQENIVQFKSCIAEEVFVIIVTKQNLKRSTPYAARLISGGIDVLEHMARREVIIKRLYATSRTSRGIKLAKDLEFKQIIPPNEEDNLLRFMIDLEASQSPLLKNYQRIVKRVLARK